MRSDTAVRGAGLIPAHAGSTFSGRYMRIVLPAHPRSRGEHDLDESAVDLITGSSPLTRGARVLLYAECVA